MSTTLRHFGIITVAALATVVVLSSLLTAQNRSSVVAERFASDANRIGIAQDASGIWRVGYTVAIPVLSLDLGPVHNGFRARSWRVETPNLVLTQRDGRDYVEAADGRSRFQTVSFAVNPHPQTLAKQYQPFTPLGEAGAVLYTGHFLPWRSRRVRRDFVFDFHAADGAEVYAQGSPAASIAGWRSPYNHPAFVYFGTVPITDTKEGVFVVDAAAPAWIASELMSVAPKLLRSLEQSFDRPLGARPSIFLAYKDGGDPGRLRYSGDALPAQFLITLSGGGWSDESTAARDLLRRASAHEAAHLWQTEARPARDGVPDWIHEGAADAIAAEALIAAGYWSQTDADRAFGRARRECGEKLAGRSLLQAESEGAYRIVYSCGHVLAVAGARHGSVTAFWRVLIDRATRSGGYDEEMFLALVEEQGGEELSSAIRAFARTPLARPDKSIDELLRLAAS